MNYNGAVVTARLSIVIACVAALGAGACEKKKPVTDTGPVNALDRANEDKGPVEKAKEDVSNPLKKDDDKDKKDKDEKQKEKDAAKEQAKKDKEDKKD